jgi:hypothetical protein
MYYSCKYHLNDGIKGKSICPECRKKFKGEKITEWVRECPNPAGNLGCKGKLYYSCGDHLDAAIKKKSLCPSCTTVKYFQDHPEAKENLSKKSKNRIAKTPVHNKGKTNVETYGPEKAAEISKKISDAAKKQFESPEAREKLSKAAIKQFEDPAMKELFSKNSKKIWEDPEMRRRASENTKRQFEDPNMRKLFSENTKRQFEDPAMRKLFSENSKRQFQDPEQIRMLRENNKKQFEDPIKRRRHRLACQKQIEDHLANGGQLSPNYDSDGCDYFEYLMEQVPGMFIYHAQNGGEFRIRELGFWPDGYDEEKFHFEDGKLRERDIRRQKEIEDFLGCYFVRVRANH